MDTSDLAMADYQLIGDFGYHSGYGSATGQPTGQAGQQQQQQQQQQPGLPVQGSNMPSSAVLSGISGQSSSQAYHQLQSQHASRAAYPQSNDPIIGHKIHSQYPNYGSGGSGVQTLVRGQYPTPDPRYVQHGIADYNSAMSQSHLSSQSPMSASAYGQQNMIGQYAGQRMHSPGVTPSRQPSGPIHGMPSHYSASYPSAPTQGGYHTHPNPNSDIWTSQGVPHMQQSSTYPGYPGSAPSGPSSQSVSHPPGVGMHGPRGQSQYVGHSEYSASAMHQQEQQRQYYSSTQGPTGSASMTGHIPTDGPTLPYPTPPQGPYSGSSASQQQSSTRGSHSAINASVPRQQYMGYNTSSSLQPQPPPQQVSQAQQNSGSSISRYPQQYPGYPQPSSYGEASAQSRLSPYPLPQGGPQGPNSPQFRPGYPAGAASQISALSPRRPTTTPPAGSPMPPSSHTPDRSASTATPSQASTHQSSFPISPGANHLASPVQGMSPGSSVPSTPSSLQQLEQMVMPHLGGVQNNSKASIPVSTNSSSSSSSTSSYYGSVGPTTPSAGAAPPSPQPPPNAGQRQTQGLYSHYPTSGNMPSNQSQYQYHQYQQNSSHWSGPQPNQITPVAVSSSNSATSITNTHSIGGVSGGIPLQPQSTLPSIGQSQTTSSNTNLQQHQNSPSVASNSSSPNVNKSDVSITASNSISGQYNSYSSELNAVSASDSNYSQTFVSRSTTSSTNSTPSSSSSSSQPLQSGYNVSQGVNNNSASFDSTVIKQQKQQQSQAAQNDTQQSQQQSQSQAAVAQMASPTNIFDSIKSPNAGTPRPLSEQLANDLQQQKQSNQQQSERIPNSQSVPGTQPLIPSAVGHPSHHPYHQMMHQQQVHQPYQTQQMPNYQNSYDPGLNYELNAVTSDMSQSSAPYGEHDSSMMYDSYGMDSMVPPQMADYHRDSADFGPLDPYSSANFDDSYGEPPTKRKGKGRPKKDPNEPKKERKPRQPRAPRGSGRGRGRGNKNNTGDRMPPMMPPDYDSNYGMPSDSMDMYSHDMYGQHMPPSTQSALSQAQQQQSQSIPSMPLTPQAPPPQQQQQQQQAPPPPPPPPPTSQTPPPQQQLQTNHSQQQPPIQQQSPIQQQLPVLQEPQNETPVASPVPPVQSHNYTPPIAEQPIPQIIEKPLENEQTLYEDNFLGQTTINENNSLNETTLISMPTDEEPNLSVAVPSEGDLYTPPRQISPCPPPTTDEVIPEPKIDSYEFADEQQLTSTPLKTQKPKKAKKRKPKKEVEVEEEPDSEVKPPKPKKVKKRKKPKPISTENEETEVKEPQLDDTESSLKASQTNDFDDATQESSQCESSAIESSTGKSSTKKEKNSKRDSKPKKPKIKNKSPKKKLPKLALKFSKNKKRRRLGSPDHSDLERTPPPSPDDAESGIQKRRSARNTKRQKYTDDIELELSEDDDKKLDSSGFLTPLNSDGKPLGDGHVVSVVSNINEDTMVVEKIMTSRLAQREIEVENPETTESDPNFKAPTIEVEEYFVKYKNLSYFHCEWKTEEELEKGDRRMSQKVKRFKQKKDVMNMFDFLDEEPYNPDYIEVDRILDVNEIEEIVEVFPNEIENNETVVEKLKEETETSQKESEVTEEPKQINESESPLVPNESDKNDLENSDINEKSDDRSSEKILEEKCENEAKSPDICETELDKKDENEVNSEEEKVEKSEEEKDEIPELVKEEEPPKIRKVKHYLVKWRALAYEDSTWELEDDLDPLKVEQFWKFRKPPPKNEWKPKRRPKSADWKKIDDSPVYKSDNTLREYQLEGLNWLSFCWYNGQNCILADEMGLGKTIQSIAFVNEICNYGIPGPFLIIAPLSTIGNWQREFETWTDLNVITYHGSSASRNMLQEYEMYYKNDKNERIPGIYKFQVMITTFEIVLTDCLELREIHWRTCIIDEAHRLKNRNCKLLEGLRLLDMEHRVLLTGTPLQNNVEELFSLLNFLEPTQFTSNESFMLEFGDLKTEAQVDKLKAILKPMMLRRLKEDVEKSLAPKEETIVEVELTNIQKKYYRAILERNFQFLSKGGTYANMPNLMNTMMELRKCCIHPFLINGAEDQIMMEYRHQHGGDISEPTVNAIVQASGKLVLIDKLLPRLRANGHRVLLFSQMVRCLDILEDYMVQKRYPYERIDGRVRGNLRQAAIDRFCKPDSDRFVFLLCTRAGGLGINLTAADTVIIFDSDWNPQNDLQAQARCHRIGQSKSVKVYRLICRNTYEREMFDKASLKLGLDRAVLQSLNTQKANLVDNQLSKKEIEDLLRKGAYGALMEDDNAGDKFCEEDIEQILQRRTQKVIIESEGKGSTFSKASFASSSNRSDIEIDDPNFWEKWAKKANFDVDELKGRNDLIVQEPRRRTQTKRFGADDAVLDMSELESSDEDDDSVSMRTRGGRNRLPKGKKGKKGRGGGYERERDEDYLQEFGPGNWTRAECYKVEKGLLTFGWGRWGECLVLGNFRRQLSRLDVESISRVLLLYALQNYKGDEKIKSFIWDLITPNEDGEHRIHRNHSGLSAPVPRGRKNKKMKKTVGEELESADWAKDDKFNPDVLLTDDMYRKHLHRHANKILLRVRLLYYLKHEIIGDLHEQVFSGITARDIPIPPPVADGDPPAQWWDEDADKSLLVGVYKHGYDRFNLMRQDPALCFLHRCGPPDGAALLAEMNADDDLGKTLDEDDEPETPATPATPLSETDCGKIKPEKAEPIAKDEPEVSDQPGALLPFPSAADMNHRLRRVVTSYQRNFKKQEMKLAQRARHQQRLERLERFEAAIKEREIKKREQAQKKWSRREEADFYRVVSSFGVEYKRDEDRYEWTRFRSFGRLERKLDETLTEYFKAFYAMCKRVTGRRLTEEEENLPISVDPISEERASRCLARIDLLSKIREEILTHPEIDERLQLCQHSMDLPDWWICGKHDKDLLIGAAKYGLNRLDFNLMSDTELSFIDVLKQFEIGNEKKVENSEQKIDESKTECEDSNKLDSTPNDSKSKNEKQDLKESDDEKKCETKVTEENDISKETSDDKPLDLEMNEKKNLDEKDSICEKVKSENELKEDQIKDESKESSDEKEEKHVIEDEIVVKAEKTVEKDKSLREILDRKDHLTEHNSELDFGLSEDNKESKENKKSETETKTNKEVEDNENTNNEKVLPKDEISEKCENTEKIEKESEEKMECEEEKKVESDELDEKKVQNEEEVGEETSIKTEESIKAVETNEKESAEPENQSSIKTELESVCHETEVSTANTLTPQQSQQKSSLRWPKDRVLQMRLEQICHTVEKNEWPSLRHSFFSLISGPLPSTPSVATADSSPRPISPCSLSSVSREPTPHPTPDHTPRREALSPLPDFFYDNSVSLNDSASRRRRRRRRRFEVEAERAKLRNLLTQTIEQQQQQQQQLPSSKKQTSLLSGSTPQFLPPLFTLPFCNIRSAIRDELMTDEKTASLLLSTSLQSSLAAAAANVQSNTTSNTTNTTTTSSNAKGPPPAHQNSSVRSNNSSMGTLDLTGRFKSSPKIATPPAPAHKPAPPKGSENRVIASDVLDLSSASVPPKRSRGNSPAKRSSQTDSNPTPNISSSKKNSRKSGSRIDALALNLQAKKMMEEKQSDPKMDKIESNMTSMEKRQATYFMDELNKHSAQIQSKLASNPPAAHSGTSSQSSKLNDASLLSKSNPHFGALDASKLPPSKVNEASSIVEQVAIIRQNLRSLFEDHPEFIAQNPSMASMVAASAANVFNPNMNMNAISSIPANTELLELPDSRRRGRRTRIDPSQLDMQHLTGEENVSVINRTTGKKITGSKAPPLKHLAEWLDKNPKFDVDPKWSPLIKEKAATFKTPTSLSNIGVRTRTSDKRGSNSSSSNMNMNTSSLMNNNLNNSSGSSSSSRRSTAASLLANQYGNAFGNTPSSTSSGLNFPSSAALNSLGFNASMLAAGFPSMKMFMDPTSSSTTSSSTATTSSSKAMSTNSSSATTSATTTTTASSGSAPPLFFPFGGLAGMGLANPLFGFPSFNLPGLTPNSNNMSGTSFTSDKKDSDNTSNEKSKSSGKSSSSSSKNKNNMNSSGLFNSSSSAAASALGSGALPFLYPSPNFLYNPLSLSGFSLPSSPFALAAHTGLMNGLGNLSTTSMSGYTPTNTTNSSNTSHSSKTKTTSSKSSKLSHSSSSVSNAPSGLSLASSLLASAGVHPSSAAAAAAIGDSDDDSLKSLMGNDDDDDLNGDFDDKDMIDNSDFEMEAKNVSSKKKSSSSKSSSKDITKSKKSGHSITTSKVSPN